MEKAKNAKQFDLSRGSVITASEVEQEFRSNKKSKYLCIYAPSEGLKPYSDFIYGWVIKYVILDKDLNLIKNN